MSKSGKVILFSQRLVSQKKRDRHKCYSDTVTYYCTTISNVNNFQELFVVLTHFQCFLSLKKGGFKSEKLSGHRIFNCSVTHITSGWKRAWGKNEGERTRKYKLQRQNGRQQIKHNKLYSDLLQA